LFILFIFGFAGAQGLPVRGERLDPAPSNPLVMPGTALGTPQGWSDSLFISSGMLTGLVPPVPNLDVGFTYTFGDEISTGSFNADYLYPRHIRDGILFAEGHVEYLGFWRDRSSAGTEDGTGEVFGAQGIDLVDTSSRSWLFDRANRLDISLGGGYRKLMGNDALVGINAFFDTSRIYPKWYSSWGWGLEAAAIIAGEGAVDLTFNYYGMQFNRNAFFNAFRNQGTSFDLEAGYSQPILDKSLDLRVKVNGYQFDTGRKTYGWRTGIDLTTRDGVFTVKYECGFDEINQTYHSISGNIRTAVQLGNLLRGESPFSLPPPVFVNPRNISNMLTRKVKRNWHQPASVLTAGEAISSSEEPFVLINSQTRAPFWFNIAPGNFRNRGNFWPPPGTGLDDAVMDGMRRIELIVQVIANPPGDADVVVGIRFRIQPGGAPEQTIYAPVPIPGNAPVGSTFTRFFTGAQVRQADLSNMNARAVRILNVGAGNSRMRVRVTVNIYR
jgi:hypothetical protein